MRRIRSPPCKALVQPAAAARPAGALPVLEFHFDIAFRLSLALFRRHKPAFLAPAKLAMCDKTLQQKFRRGYGLRRIIRDFDLQRRKLFEEPLDLLEVGKSRRAGLVIVELHVAAEVEPLLDLLRVGFGEVAVVDLADREC